MGTLKLRRDPTWARKSVAIQERINSSVSDGLERTTRADVQIQRTLNKVVATSNVYVTRKNYCVKRSDGGQVANLCCWYSLSKGNA